MVLLLGMLHARAINDVESGPVNPVSRERGAAPHVGAPPDLGVLEFGGAPQKHVSCYQVYVPLHLGFLQTQAGTRGQFKTVRGQQEVDWNAKSNRLIPLCVLKSAVNIQGITRREQANQATMHPLQLIQQESVFKSPDQSAYP